jgi:hypothetical protein
MLGVMGNFSDDEDYGRRSGLRSQLGKEIRGCYPMEKMGGGNATWQGMHKATKKRSSVIQIFGILRSRGFSFAEQRPPRA